MQSFFFFFMWLILTARLLKVFCRSMFCVLGFYKSWVSGLSTELMDTRDRETLNVQHHVHWQKKRKWSHSVRSQYDILFICSNLMLQLHFRNDLKPQFMLCQNVQDERANSHFGSLRFQNACFSLLPQSDE